MTDKAEKLNGIVQGILKDQPRLGLTLMESFRQENREGKFAPIPDAYREFPQIIQASNALGISPDALYTSQAEPLDWLSVGVSVFTTTETASGKSYVFQQAALWKILQDPNARVLVLYPTRALNSDQLISWQQMMKAADLPAHKVGLLDGGVGYNDRLEVVKDARILLATPDIIHTWMLANPQIKDPHVQEFLKNIRLRVIDEAHINDGILGTKFSYLMRRMTVLQRLLNPKLSAKEYWENYGQVTAASATISDPGAFLHQLTGLAKDQQIIVIDPTQDGSPRKARQILRVAAPKKKVNEFLNTYLAQVAQMDPDAKSIVFVDSRKLAENIAKDLNEMLGTEAAASYKSGYTREVRAEIENNFRDPKSPLKILVATSAAEVGINMLPVQNVINIGIPESQSSMQQRAGRIRKGGLVMFIERVGVDLDVHKHEIRKAFTQPPKRPTLYRKNEGIQAQMLACAIDEIQNLTGRKAKVSDFGLTTWPEKFVDMARDVLSGERKIKDILHRKVPGNTTPQRYFSLRDADGGRARVVMFAPGIKKTVTLEELSHLQALTEAYPGGSMLHRGDYYRIKKWNENARGEAIIHAEYSEPGRLTRAFMKSALTTNLYHLPHHTAIQTDKMRVGKLNKGDFMANVGFTVRTSVEGFTEFQDYISDGSKLGAVFYSSSHMLEDKNPCKDLKAPTPYRSWHKGVLMRVQESWFHMDSRKILGRAIIDEYAKKNKLSANDFDLYVDGIEAKYSQHYGYNVEQGNMMAICESSISDFGLANKLTNDLPEILLDLCQHESDVVRRLAMLMYQWNLGLHEINTPTQDEAAKIHLKPVMANNDDISCFMPGSLVSMRENPKNEKSKKETVRITDVQLYEGEVLYQFVPTETKTLRGRAPKECIRSLPARHFSVEQGNWYTYGTFDKVTGQLTTANNESFEKLADFEFGRASRKKEPEASLRLQK